jgi:hypothetical protein
MENDWVVLIRAGIWYIFNETAFKAGAGGVPIEGGDRVFAFRDKTKVEDLRNEGTTVFIGGDAVRQLRR